MHYSLRTEQTYVYWIRWFIRYSGLRHPKAVLIFSTLYRQGLRVLRGKSRNAKLERNGIACSVHSAHFCLQGFSLMLR